ncbi:MAG: zinc transport system substrate-binding protein [Rhodothermales bacterium]|jgi:zinc transport system substrate-binding protein
MRVFLLLLFLVGCSPAPAPKATQTGHLQVYASSYPLHYFASRIGGQQIHVSSLPAGSDPATWMPERQSIQAIQQADLILLNGAGFESWPAKVSLPDSRVVRTAAPLKPDFIHYEDRSVHTHGPEGEHAHEGLDGHTWLDPQNAKIQAEQIRAELARARPGHAAAFAANYAALIADLDSLDAALGALPPKPLLASHPAYNYLARRYEWRIENLDLDPQTMPTAESLAGIKKLLRQHPASQLLWEQQPAAEIANLMQKQLGLSSIVFSPCETEPGNGQDYLSVMRKNIAALGGAFSRD